MNHLINIKNQRITSKQVLFTIIEFVLVFFLSYSLIKYFNKDVSIKALHLDDLHNLLEYLKEPNLKDWIFKYYETAMHYRPVFYIGLFFYFALIGTKVSRVLSINIILCSILATSIYYLARSLKINRLLSLSIVFLFGTINFLYYEIYQLIGFIEGFSMLFSLVLLVLSIKMSYESEKKFKQYSVLCLVFYFLLVFLHERYFPMLLLPLIATSLNKQIDKNSKKRFVVLYYAELVFFFAIRYYHLRIIIPRGTDCTSLVDNFDLGRSFVFVFHQLMYLFGVNLGPEYLCGIDFINTSRIIKVIILLSIVIFMGIVCVYARSKRYHINISESRFSIKHIDLLFLLYIFLCILQSSLTIRVELRWLLASFVGLMFYLSYMIMYIFEKFAHKQELTFRKYVVASMFIIFFVLRLIMNDYFNKNFEKLFIINEQKVVNSLYENTVEKYGIDDIKNKSIYITTDYYRALKPEELTHFFDQYDRKLNDRQVIYLGFVLEQIEDNPKEKYDIVLNEVGNWRYAEQ